MVERTVAWYIRDCMYTILSRKHIRTVTFIEAFREIRERIQIAFWDFSDSLGEERKTLRRDYFITSLLVKGSNLAIFSDGEELYITYANHLEFRTNYLNLTFQEKQGSRASIMRQTAREELRNCMKVSLSYMKKVTQDKGLALRIQALLIKKALFVIFSEKDGVYITIKNRVHW